MDSAAVFLAGTILYALGCIVILIAVVVANNIIHKFWKSFGWKFFSDWYHGQPAPRFMNHEEESKLKKVDKTVEPKL